jgi:hypothetical protein
MVEEDGQCHPLIKVVSGGRGWLCLAAQTELGDAESNHIETALSLGHRWSHVNCHIN